MTMMRYLLPAALILSVTGCAGADERSEEVAVDESAKAAEGKFGDVTFRRLAPGVWLHSAYHTTQDFGTVVSNGLVVENGDSAILIDTAWDDAQTRSILGWARERLGRPILAAITTHAHSDKMGGMTALHEAGVRTFASRLSNGDAPGRGLTPATTSLDFDSGGWLAPASRKDAAPLGKLRVFYPGAGHTHDNIVVAIPAASIVFGGCLIRPPESTDMGNVADGDLPHWGIAAEAVGKAFPDAQVVVPSHGPPAGRELLALTSDLARKARAAQHPS